MLTHRGVPVSDLENSMHNGRRSIMIRNVAHWNAFLLDGLFILM